MLIKIYSDLRQSTKFNYLFIDLRLKFVAIVEI